MFSTGEMSFGFPVMTTGGPDARSDSLEPFANAFIESHVNNGSVAAEEIGYHPSGHKWWCPVHFNNDKL